MPGWEVKGAGVVDHFGCPVNVRSQKAFVWPKDRPGLSKARRALDVLFGRGPDMFVTTNVNRKPGANGGPSRRRWSGWPGAESNPMLKESDENAWRGQPLARVGWGVRQESDGYDFQKRKYVNRFAGTLTDIRHDPWTGSVAAVEQWPNFNSWQPYVLGGDTAYFDPRNTGGFCNGPDGEGGYYHAALV